MFEAQEEDTVFMETVKNLRHHPHMILECIPMPRETGEMAPIYFKVMTYSKTHLSRQGVTRQSVQVGGEAKVLIYS